MEGMLVSLGQAKQCQIYKRLTINCLNGLEVPGLFDSDQSLCGLRRRAARGKREKATNL